MEKIYLPRMRKLNDPCLEKSRHFLRDCLKSKHFRFLALLLFISNLAIAQNTPLGIPATQNADGTTDVPGTPAACASS